MAPAGTTRAAALLVLALLVVGGPWHTSGKASSGDFKVRRLLWGRGAHGCGELLCNAATRKAPSQRCARPHACRMSCNATRRAILAPCTRTQLSELMAFRDAAKDKVIGLGERTFFDYLAGKSRPYTLVVFFAANVVLEKNPQLQIDVLRKEFGLLAKAADKGPDRDKVFFADIVFEEAQAVFQALQIQQLPLIVRFGPSAVVSRNGYTPPNADKMTPETVQGPYPWTAETMAEAVVARHGNQVGPIERPSIFKHPAFPGLIVALVVGLVLLLRLFWVSGVLWHPALYCFGALLVFWFSSSGGMFNIIRGMPFYIRDRDGQIRFFLNSRQAQLGAEGFILGSTYLGFSACVALLTYAVPRISSPQARQGIGYGLVILAAYSVFKTFELHTAKTGHQIVSYL